MPKLKIFSFPDVVLTQKAAPIARVEKQLYSLADDMLETMYEAIGVGLAANQVGVLQRILVIDVDYDLDEDALDAEPSQKIFDHKNPQILINPEITYREGHSSLPEACLSVPDFRAEVKRAEKIKCQFQTIDGLTRQLSADGLLAICIQHEIDHLDGKLFIDRLSPIKKDLVRKKLRAERLERESRIGTRLRKRD